MNSIFIKERCLAAWPGLPNRTVLVGTYLRFDQNKLS